MGANAAVDMKIVAHSLAYPVTSLGPGRRVVLWVAGCSRRCPGCISPELLTSDAGQEVAVERVLDLARPGGVVVLTVPNGSVDHWDGHVNFWTPDQFTAWLRPRGLDAVELVDGGQTLLAVLRRAAANAGSARHAA